MPTGIGTDSVLKAGGVGKREHVYLNPRGKSGRCSKKVWSECNGTSGNILSFHFPIHLKPNHRQQDLGSELHRNC